MIAGRDRRRLDLRVSAACAAIFFPSIASSSLVVVGNRRRDSSFSLGCQYVRTRILAHHAGGSDTPMFEVLVDDDLAGEQIAVASAE